MLRCPNCSAPVEGKAKACDYCSAPLDGLEKHAEVEWPVRCPEAEALVAIDLRCPSGRPLDPVRGLLEVTFAAVVRELGADMAIRGVERELQRRLPKRLDDCYRIRALRLTAFTPTWSGGPTQRQRPLFQAKRRAPSSNPNLGDDGVREELVAPVKRTRAPVDSGFDPTRFLIGVGLTLALAAVMGGLLAIGVWISHHIVLTILLTCGLLAAGAVVWGARRDRERKQKWEAHLATKRGASGRVAIESGLPVNARPRPAPELAKPAEVAKPKPEVAKPKPEVAKPKPEAAKPKPEVAKPKPEAEAAQPTPEAVVRVEPPGSQSDSSVSLSAPSPKKRDPRERTR